MGALEQLVIVRTDLEGSGGMAAAVASRAASEWLRLRLLENPMRDGTLPFAEAAAVLTEGELAFLEDGCAPTVCHARDASHLLRVERVAGNLGLFAGADWFRIGAPDGKGACPHPQRDADVAAIGFVPLQHAQAKTLSRKYALLKGC